MVFDMCFVIGSCEDGIGEANYGWVEAQHTTVNADMAAGGVGA